MLQQSIERDMAPDTLGARGITPAPNPQGAPNEVETILLTVAPFYMLVLTVILLGAGLLLAMLFWPGWIASVGDSLAGVKPHAYWYLSRSSAMVSFVLLWCSMALGLAITNKMARAWPGGPTVAALHEYASLLGLAAGVFHALILLGDGYIGYTLNQILIPFAGDTYRPLWVGLGQVALYLSVLVTLSFYVRRWMGYRLWRLVHYLSFAVFLLALAHGLMSGTDSGTLLARDLYWVSAVSLAGLTCYRVMAARARR
jgi:predicted ferric reductase